ncbi:hypothetical protein BKA69DRAFT_1046561 [Paraphysoderma sedebokerense]|nr:hypothetical protein BKA69DRAFT_1046561 [Paraphysoderma sedebokerense]
MLHRDMKLISTLYLLAALTGLSSGATKKCFGTGKLCFQANVIDNTTVIMQINYTVAGWVSVGIGSSMSSADTITIWNNGGNNFVVQDGMSTSQVMPPKDATQNYAIVSAVAGNPNVVTVTRAINTGDAKDKAFTNAAQSMIYAYCLTAVSNDSPGMHDSKGTFSYNVFDTSATVYTPPGTNLTNPGTSNPGTSNPGSTDPNNLTDNPDDGTPVEGALSYNTAVLIHAVLMVFAWHFCAHIAVFLARYMKSTMPTSWFKIHRALFILVCVCTITGFAVMYASISGHFRNTHGIVGLLMLICMLLQSVLGFVIDRLFKPNRKRVPWYDMVHWWLGKLLVASGPLTIMLGLLQNSSSNILIAFYTMMWASFLAVFAVAEVKIGQTHEHTHSPPPNKPDLETPSAPPASEVIKTSSALEIKKTAPKSSLPPPPPPPMRQISTKKPAQLHADDFNSRDHLAS